MPLLHSVDMAGRERMHEGDSSNTPLDLHPVVQSVNAVIIQYQWILQHVVQTIWVPHSTLLCLHVNQQFFLHSTPIYSRSSPSWKAAIEEVPMEDNPAYGVVSVYDNVQEQITKWSM